VLVDKKSDLERLCKRPKTMAVLAKDHFIRYLDVLPHPATAHVCHKTVNGENGVRGLPATNAVVKGKGLGMWSHHRTRAVNLARPQHLRRWQIAPENATSQRTACSEIGCLGAAVLHLVGMG